MNSKYIHIYLLTLLGIASVFLNILHILNVSGIFSRISDVILCIAYVAFIVYIFKIIVLNKEVKEIETNSVMKYGIYVLIIMGYINLILSILAINSVNIDYSRLFSCNLFYVLLIFMFGRDRMYYTKNTLIFGTKIIAKADIQNIRIEKAKLYIKTKSNINHVARLYTKNGENLKKILGI